MHHCAVIIGRGGGAREDLAAFNEEIVADAIYECSVPVISAVGHEIDVTLADLVADHRAETPSAAVGLLTPDREEMMDDLLRIGRGLSEAVRNRIAYAKQSVTVLATRPALRKPFDRIRQAEQRLDEIAVRLQRGAGLAVDRGQRKIESAMEQLDALSPLGVLKRGYSLTQRGDGSVVRAVGDVAEGEILQTRLAEGTILSKVIRPPESRPDA
jgi:exodeoxyribonuclease VII large subunit